MGGKGGRCVRLTTLPPSCTVVTKSGNLKFLERSGPLQACNGTDLPLLLLLSVMSMNNTSDTNFWTVSWRILLNMKMFQAKVVEKIKTHILCPITNFPKSYRL